MEKTAVPLNWPICPLGWLLAENIPWLAFSAQTCPIGTNTSFCLLPTAVLRQDSSSNGEKIKEVVVSWLEKTKGSGEKDIVL